MGGTVIDIYDYPKVNPVVKVLTDNRMDNLEKRTGPVFEDFLRKQIQTNRKIEQQQEESKKSEAKKEPSVDMNLIASQCASINSLVNKEEKKVTDFEKRNAARAYGF